MLLSRADLSDIEVGKIYQFQQHNYCVSKYPTVAFVVNKLDRNRDAFNGVHPAKNDKGKLSMYGACYWTNLSLGSCFSYDGIFGLQEVTGNKRTKILSTMAGMHISWNGVKEARKICDSESIPYTESE